MAHLDAKKVLEFVHGIYQKELNEFHGVLPMDPEMLMFKAVVLWDKHLRNDFTWGMAQDKEPHANP